MIGRRKRTIKKSNSNISSTLCKRERLGAFRLERNVQNAISGYACIHCTNVGASTIERSLAINGVGAKKLETHHYMVYSYV